MAQRKLLPMVLLLALLTPAAALAGVEVTMEIREPGSEEAHTVSRMVAQGERMRLDTGPSSILFLGDEQRLLTIDHDNGWYGEMNPQLIAALKNQLAGTMRELERQLAQLPEDQRAQAEALITQRMSPAGAEVKERVIQATEETRQVAGFPAVRYEILEDGVKVQDVWVTDWRNVPSGEELKKSFGQMGAFVQRMVDSLSELPRMEALVQRLGSNMLGQLTELPGLPVLATYYEGGDAQQELAVVAVDPGKVEAAELLPPEGYKARNLFLGAVQ